MNKFFVLISILSISASCKQNKFDVNTNNIDTEISIQRIEQDLFEMNFDSIDNQSQALHTKYGEFYKLYTESVLKLGDINSALYCDNLKKFITNYSVYAGYKEALSVFNNMEVIEKELTNAFKYYTYYFPERMAPEVYTIITGYNQSLVVDEGVIAIGLDKYLGRECEFYSRLNIYNYLKLNMHKGMIVSDCMKAWALTEFPFNDSINNILSNMLYHGKIHYFQKAMMPFAPDSIIMGYTDEHIKWCQHHEKQMWLYLVENKLLFDTEYLKIKKFTEPSSYTKDFGQYSPGRAINWIGWRIISEYMDKNPGISLKDLMNSDDYQTILQKSKYRP